MNFFAKRNLLIILIIFVAAFLRFYQLGTNPPSLTWDEAAWGYNAYSMGIDGRDEFGRFLPYDYLESFGDFKPPMYAYLSIIPVKIFGLNEFATRFASAFFGTFTVLVTYFLTVSLFPNRKNFPFFAAFLLAISPWHIMLSRAAFEANLATFFIALGVLLFLKALQRNPTLLIFSVISFVASIYTFNSARVVSPVLLICLSLFHWKKLIVEKKSVMLSIVVGLVLILPIFNFLISPQASLRFKEVNIFSDINLIKISNQQIANDNNALWSRVLHNRRVVYAREVVRHYFDNLSPEFLFINGDANTKFSTQDVGQMYLWELPFFVTGLLFLIKRREKNWWIVPMWLLIGIIPASLARETPHALRIEGSLPTFQIMTAYGISEFLIWLKSRHGALKKLSTAIITLISFVLFVNVSYFLHGYYFHYARENSGDWQYGYKEAISYIQTTKRKYDNVQIGDTLGRPYIYTLFYTKYNPQKFRQEADITRDAFGFVHIHGFGRYKFPESTESANKKSGKTLFVNDPRKMPKGGFVLKTFYLLNGQPVLAAYTL